MVSKEIEGVYESEKERFEKKIFVLDHTAEILENYRRMHENNIFNQILFDERNKKAFLRRESRDKNTILGDNWKPDQKLLSVNDFSEATRVEAGKEPYLELPESDHTRYQQDKNQLANARISALLLDSS